jgi:hypothetical protein
LEHQGHQRNLHQPPAKKGGAYAIREKRSASATVNALQFENRVAQTNGLPRFARQSLFHCLVSKVFAVLAIKAKLIGSPESGADK